MPNCKDVLVGKGKPIQLHPGNLFFRQSVEYHLPEFVNANKKADKTHLNRQIVKLIKNGGGRFLKRDPVGWWEEVTDDEAREKVSKTFGSARAIVSSDAAKPSNSKRQQELLPLHPNTSFEKDKRAKIITTTAQCDACCFNPFGGNSKI